MSSLKKPTFVFVIGLIFIGLITISADSKKYSKRDLEGKWVMVNQFTDTYFLHDTIIFHPKHCFETTIVSQTMNQGKWKKRGNKILLKAHLHYADNPYKSRKYKWTWLIIEQTENRIAIQQDGKTKIEYKRVKE